MDGEPLRRSLEGPWAVFDRDQAIGWMARTIRSPLLGEKIGLANTPVDRSNRDDRLMVRTRAGMVRGAIAPTPFVTSSEAVPWRRGAAGRATPQREVEGFPS